jgi:peptide methionine sulfoxide reductase MsrA
MFLRPLAAVDGLSLAAAAAARYLDEKRAAMPGVKIVTELEPIKKYYKAEVRQAQWRSACQ